MTIEDLVVMTGFSVGKRHRNLPFQLRSKIAIYIYSNIAPPPRVDNKSPAKPRLSAIPALRRQQPGQLRGKAESDVEGVVVPIFEFIENVTFERSGPGCFDIVEGIAFAQTDIRLQLDLRSPRLGFGVKPLLPVSTSDGAQAEIQTALRSDRNPGGGRPRPRARSSASLK